MNSIGQPHPSDRPVIPLAAATTGQQVRLVNIKGGHRLRSRLAGMGLLPGMMIRVVRNAGGGPIVVLVHNTRLALGRGMVHHLVVAPLADPPPPAAEGPHD